MKSEPVELKFRYRETRNKPVQPTYLEELPVVGAFGNDQRDIRIAVRSTFAARSRSIENGMLDPKVSWKPREKRSHRAFGIRIQKFHDRYFEYKTAGRQ